MINALSECLSLVGVASHNLHNQHAPWMLCWKCHEALSPQIFTIWPVAHACLTTHCLAAKLPCRWWWEKPPKAVPCTILPRRMMRLPLTTELDVGSFVKNVFRSKWLAVTYIDREWFWGVKKLSTLLKWLVQILHKNDFSVCPSSMAHPFFSWVHVSNSFYSSNTQDSKKEHMFQGHWNKETSCFRTLKRSHLFWE